MNAYEEYVARALPQVWMPRPYTFNEVAKNVHGVEETLNNVTGAILPEYWWVSH